MYQSCEGKAVTIEESLSVIVLVVKNTKAQRTRNQPWGL